MRLEPWAFDACFTGSLSVEQFQRLKGIRLFVGQGFLFKRSRQPFGSQSTEMKGET